MLAFATEWRRRHRCRRRRWDRRSECLLLEAESKEIRRDCASRLCVCCHVLSRWSPLLNLFTGLFQGSVFVSRRARGFLQSLCFLMHVAFPEATDGTPIWVKQTCCTIRATVPAKTPTRFRKPLIKLPNCLLKIPTKHPSSNLVPGVTQMRRSTLSTANSSCWGELSICFSFHHCHRLLGCIIHSPFHSQN